MDTKTILHLSSVHPRFDTRIFYRECQSLASNGFQVILMVADGKGDAHERGVDIIDIGKPSGRFSRLLITPFKILWRLSRMKAVSSVHIHDPELIWVAAIIRKLKKIPIIFDVHENVPAQITQKTWILFPRLVARLYKRIETVFIKGFHIVLAEYSYKRYYPSTAVSVLNFPNTHLLSPYLVENRAAMTENHLFYIGGVSLDRCIDTILDAALILKKTQDFMIHIVGPDYGTLSDPALQEKMGQLEGIVKFYGRMDWIEGYKISTQCKVGLALLKPTPNYLESYPTKLFEYMAIGLPFITSNFELYDEVIAGNVGGLSVDPENPEAIAEKIEMLLSDSDLYTELATKGLQYSQDKYNWAQEEKKLLALYKGIV